MLLSPHALRANTGAHGSHIKNCQIHTPATCNLHIQPGCSNPP
uniref:Uncharacterized protein n=1 Tax=Anguilla anguilla TaxID=7936 RepID=A0A0E9QH82_ANGAN